MRRLAIITVLCLFVVSIAGGVSAEEAVKPQEGSYKVAIVPYINSTEETKGYIQEVIDSKYTEQYSNKDFQMIPLVDIQKALNSAGYDASNLELPDKDTLTTVAKETNADYVIAMEISQLITTRHMSFFQSKVVTKAKLRYKFLNAGQEKVTTFQVTGVSENKTVFGDVGYKDPITKALNQAMDDANVKIMNSI
ncbi:hypothetical protein HSX37_09545|uniref:Lipoprotein n=1 Tax=Dendrosporobacter quercicolus TaxID=146817 RepID=A0A1G9QKF7_9FIRM|nr:hypothetical protein [Dendrosporobacter quercicolus]NSL48271.1 hypothetical protein [Dendrosporobacter quercicolus DSM 1736]SDM11341.1 hypothetical protein SAMN04488502_102205 [Dendrosporobacter quercicolus]